jgi:DNA-binding IclR family transcriptional regulator
MGVGLRVDTGVTGDIPCATLWLSEPQSGQLSQPSTAQPAPSRGSVPAVHAVERAARLLFAFTSERPALTLGDLARQAGLSKSTARRLLLTLERVGLVAVDARAGLYRLGTRCLELGAAAQASIDLRTRALPVMRRLADEAGESAYLMVPRETEAVCVEIVEARRGPRVLFTEVGTAFPLHTGAAPRALLAALPDAVASRVLAGPLRAFTAHTRTDPARLRDDVAETRRAGYAVSVEELVPGFAGIGAAIRDHRQEAIGALSISGLKERFVGPERDGLARAVVEAAREISRAMGCPEDRPA